jgi:hypothetical protein
MGDDFGKILSLFFLGCIFVLVITHSSGFATSAGSLFTTTDDLAEIFTGAKVNSTVPLTRVAASNTGTTGGNQGILNHGLSNVPGGIVNAMSHETLRGLDIGRHDIASVWDSGRHGIAKGLDWVGSLF